MDKTQTIREILKLIETNVTKEDFEENFKTLIEFVKKIVENNKKELESLREKYEGMFNALRLDNLDLINEKLSKIKNGEKGDPGKDADETVVAYNASKMVQEELLPLIPTIDAIEKDLPKLGPSVRDSLELLTGDERLSMSAINGLEEALKELSAPQVSGGFSYGAVSIHMVDDETPTGLVNGSNKDFVLSLRPSPAASLKVYLDGQRLKLTTDYSLNEKTITFVTAPLENSIITCDYRV